MDVYICIYVYICVYMCINVCMCIYVRMCIYVHVCICTYVYICTGSGQKKVDPYRNTVFYSNTYQSDRKCRNHFVLAQTGQHFIKFELTQ